MDLKRFSQESRTRLMRGVARRLLFWGFDAKGGATEEVVPVPGGYLFRGKVHDDPGVVRLHQALKAAIARKGIEAVVEEAAYTWFNRMMAMQILSKQGFEEPQLAYVAPDVHTPQILKRAQQGYAPFLQPAEKQRLDALVATFTQDAEAFALLVTGYCHNHRTLRRVFGKPDDYTELLLPDDMLKDTGFLHLLNTTDALNDEEYGKVELIGWLYQFYISERKDEVFASFGKGKKAEAKDIPAATQIFTPNWIVKYMVENTAGKAWLDKFPGSPLRGTMKYLVENEADGELQPLIGDVEDLTLIDPACGSGHILVEGFELLYGMYMERYYSPEEAVDSIFRNNLFGLDIDDRAAQLATFALLLKAAQRDRGVWDRDILPQVHAMPEGRAIDLQEVRDFLGPEGAGHAAQLSAALDVMRDAKNLGSVMKLRLSAEARETIQQRSTALGSAGGDRSFTETAAFTDIAPFLPALLLLTRTYTAVVANPPYMGQKNMNADLKAYVNEHYPNSKSDLFAVFMEVNSELTVSAARFALVNLPSWLFLSSFERLREQLLSQHAIDSMLHMGRGVFGIDFGSVAFVVRKRQVKDACGAYFRLHERNFQHIYSEDIEKIFLYSKKHPGFRYDFSGYRDDSGISEIPPSGTSTGSQIQFPDIPQTNFSKIPGSPIAYWVSERVLRVFQEFQQLHLIASPLKGMFTGDNNRFLRFLWEVEKSNISRDCRSRKESSTRDEKWYPYQKGGGFRKWYGNLELLVNFKNDGEELKSFDGYGERNPKFYFCDGCTWSSLSSTSIGFRKVDAGCLFDSKGPLLYTSVDQLLLLGLLNSKVVNYLLTCTSPTLDYNIKAIQRIPIELDGGRQSIPIAARAISLSRQEWNSREVSWDFEASPLVNSAVDLESANAHWLKQATHDFFELHKHEEELNRIFIDLYGLQDELTPDVALKDITILQEELSGKDLEALEPAFRAGGGQPIDLPINRDEVMRQFVSYCVGLMMGRYRLDKPGLHIAHPNPSADELGGYVHNGHRIEIDEDAILPLMGSNGQFPDDVLHRMHGLLDAIWGAETRTANLNFLQECMGTDLEKYLVKDFFKDHCRRYKKKPIYWLFSSPKGAFQVLVYMHRMNAFTVEKIRSNYLLEHLKHLRREEEALRAKESMLSAREAKRLDTLRKHLLECEAYDLELKDVADRQIAFDLDDGVTENHKLFGAVVAPIA